MGSLLAADPCAAACASRQLLQLPPKQKLASILWRIADCWCESAFWMAMTSAAEVRALRGGEVCSKMDLSASSAIRANCDRATSRAAPPRSLAQCYSWLNLSAGAVGGASPVCWLCRLARGLYRRDDADAEELQDAECQPGTPHGGRRRFMRLRSFFRHRL